MYYLLDLIHSQLKQLELLHSELEFCKDPTSSPMYSDFICILFNSRLATLVIARQPFPTVVFKGRQLGSNVLHVTLITGSLFVWFLLFIIASCVKLLEHSKIVGNLIFDNGSLLSRFIFLITQSRRIRSLAKALC